MPKKQINLRLDTNLLNEIDQLIKNSDLDRTQWINKALEAVTLAIKKEDSLEKEYEKILTGTLKVPPKVCPDIKHTGVYEDCQSKSQFESLG